MQPWYDCIEKNRKWSDSADHAGRIDILYPGGGEICEITAVQPFNLDSSNVVPENWSMLVKVIREHYDAFDGFIIAHGTDTMAYTAAALSYMIQNSPKPIVITGAQRPINLDITDAKTNLSDSFYYACDDASQGYRSCLTER